MAVAGNVVRRIGARWIALMALAYWLVVSACLLLVRGQELDADAVFPDIADFLPTHAQEHVMTTVSRVSTPVNPPNSVLYAFLLMGIIVLLPAVLPARIMANALRVTSIVVGACLLVSILRLGLVLAPVLALQLLALSRCEATSPSRRCPPRRTGLLAFSHCEATSPAHSATAVVQGLGEQVPESARAEAREQLTGSLPGSTALYDRTHDWSA